MIQLREIQWNPEISRKHEASEINQNTDKSLLSIEIASIYATLREIICLFRNKSMISREIIK
jgi:hypothetical protein